MSSVYGIGTLSPPILFKVPCRVYRDGEVRERPKKEADGPRSGRLAHEAARGGRRLTEPRRGHAPENEAGCVCVCGGGVTGGEGDAAKTWKLFYTPEQLRTTTCDRNQRTAGAGRAAALGRSGRDLIGRPRRGSAGRACPSGPCPSVFCSCRGDREQDSVKDMRGAEGRAVSGASLHAHTRARINTAGSR